MSIERAYLELRDNSDTLLYRLENVLEEAKWEWLRIGGCGAAKLSTKLDFDDARVVAMKPDYRIYLVIDGTTWYSGFLDNLVLEAKGEGENVSIECIGFVNLLKELVIQDVTYTSMEISAIVEDIIDTYVTTPTPITSSSGDYEDTRFTIDTITFNTTVYDAIKTLADIAGNREWGVKADKSFFFKERDLDASEEHHFFIDENISQFKKRIDYSQLVSKVIIEGGNVDGARFEQSIELTGASFTREKRLTYGSITTQSVALQLGRMYVKKYGKPQYDYSFKTKLDTRLEATVPIGGIAVNKRMGINHKYDSGIKYDAGYKYDGGTMKFQLDKIKYTLSEGDEIDAEVSVGTQFADIVDKTKQIEFIVDQVKNY